MKKYTEWFLILLWLSLVFSACGKEREAEKAETAQAELYASQEITLEEGFQAEKLCTDGEKLYVIGDLGAGRVIFSSDPNGKSLKKTKLDGIEAGEVQCFKKTEDGWMLLLDQGGAYEVVTLNGEGEEEKRVKLDTAENSFFYAVGLTEEGEVYADGGGEGFFWFGSDGTLKKQVKRKDEMTFGCILAEGGTAFCVYDLYEKEMKIYEYTDTVLKSSRSGDYREPSGHMTEITPYGNGKLAECYGDSFDFYIYDCNNIYGYSIETGQSEKVLNWLDCDFNGTEISEALAFKNNGFAVLEQKDSRAVVYCVKPSEKENQVKETVTLAVVEEDMTLKEKILDFNRSNKKVRIVVEDYSQEEDPVQALHNSLISGNVPDIVNLYSLDIRDYSSKGLLMDLTDYLEEDTEISGDDFLPNIIEACKVGGKLYFVPDSFDICLLAGEHDVIQGRAKWDMEEFSKLYKMLKKDDEIMAYYVDREDMLETLCASMLSVYINLDTGTADFQQNSFARILQCAKNTVWNEKDDAFKIMEKIQNGTILLMRFDMKGYKDYAFYKEILKNGEFIGFPSEKGSGFYGTVYGRPILAVTEKSRHKKEAFKFLKSFWTYEYQKANMGYGYPTRMDVLEKKLEYESAEKSYIDGDGDAVSAAGGSTGMNGVSVSYGAMAEKEENEIRDIVKSVDRIFLENSREQTIISMIGEEAEAYFAGDKSLEETIEMIQNRVKLYMEEKK